MKGFIAQETGVDVLNRGVASNFDYLAGTNFDAAYAAGINNMSCLTPSPNTDALFLDEQSYGLSESMLALNEDFAEFALAPINVSLINSDSNIFFYLPFEGLGSQRLLKNLNIASQILAPLLDRNNQNYIGVGSVGVDINDIREFLKSFGGNYGGNTTKALIDSVFDWNLNLNNISDALIRDSISIGGNYIQKSLTSLLGKSSLGLSSSVVAGLAAWGIKELATEIYEVSTGRDIHFGFGGERVASVKTQERDVELYKPSRDFWSGLFNTDGLNDSLLLTDKFGNFGGFGDNGLAAAWSTSQQGWVHSKTGEIYKGSVVEVRFQDFIRSGRNTISQPQMPPSVKAADIALKNYGLRYNKSKHRWEDKKGKVVDTDFLGESARKELNSIASQITGKRLNHEEGDDTYKELRNLLSVFGADIYWTVTEWGEIRPIFPLTSLEAGEIVMAFQALAHALDQYSIGAPQTFDPYAIERQITQVILAQQEMMENLLNTYDEWVRKAKRYSRKNETYPIVYL